MATLRKLQVITSVDATAVELQAIDKPMNVPLDIFIKVKSDSSGTVQFQVAKAGTTIGSLDWSTVDSWSASDIPPVVTITNGDQNLFYKASGAGAKFTIGY